VITRSVLLPTAALIFALAGCAQTPRPQQPVVQQEEQTKRDVWQEVANASDVSRIARLGSAWETALREARVSYRREVAAEGDLLNPQAALARPAPTPGSYECRLVRLGKTEARTRAFERFKPFFCYVEVDGDLLTIVKQTGSQRPAGRLWEDDETSRLVFLGSLALGDEQQPKAYGDDPQRDMAGVLERIAPFRWRLVIPWPRGTSKLDVFELTPVAEQPRAS
jgi:hypothetical protein